MKRFGEWQMRTYRPPGWHKEIFARVILHGKNGENRRDLDKWVSSRGIRMREESNLENEFLDRPDNAAKTLYRFVVGMSAVSFLFQPRGRTAKGRGGGLEEQLQEITTS